MDINHYMDEPVSIRQNTIYKRTYQRNIPSHQLQPYLDSRPITTKFSTLPILDSRNFSSVPVIQHPTFNNNNIYHSGIDSGPWSGFASNVNDESVLRNQIFALQNNNQYVFIPSSSSSLYNVKWQNEKSENSDLFPNINKKEQFNAFSPNQNDNIIGYSLFNNHTRQQNKDLTN